MEDRDNSEGCVSVNNYSSPEAKIVLFRSLFRGRDDVYPRRFENTRTGQSGYAPVCANEWARGLCDKRKVKCAQCPNRQFLPVTDEVIGCHLRGKDERGNDFVMGIYPMLQDETCFFLAADFDKKNWQDDVAAFCETCRQMNLPVAVERSRSGKGGHVWVFFEQAINAALARRLGAYILTETMERRPDIGLDSYDRFFPNQDTLPTGGFGNLIALPLQKLPRQQGNSMFLDENFQPYSDQWAYLSTIQKITKSQVENLVSEAESRGRITGVRMALSIEGDDETWLAFSSRQPKEPPITGELPKTIELVLANQIYIEKTNLPAGLRNRFLRLAAFQNPEFYQAQAMRLNTYDKPRIIACGEDLPQYIALPRGCLDDIQKLLRDVKVKYKITDKRNEGKPLDVTFHGQLRPPQQTAADIVLSHDTGVLSAATAFGKTVVAAWIIAQRGVNTLILVHRRQLLQQWKDRLATFLNIPKKEIGQVGGGRKKLTGSIDIATIQSLFRKGEVNDCVNDYGQLIVDECHHLSAYSFEQVARQANAKFVLGLSATVTRKDGHHPIIFMQCGPLRHNVTGKQHARVSPFSHTVLVRPTGFQSVASTDSDKRIEFQQLYDELISDDSRNHQICHDVVDAVKQGRCPVVITERREHLERLSELLADDIKHLIILRGGMGKKQLQEAADKLKSVPQNEPRVLLATGRYLGEGFDDARLDTLFLTLPVSWRGTIAQYAGRLHRLFDGKQEVRIYDYADLNVPMLSRMFDRRCKGYESIGYSIMLPASAVSGWPVEVPLPVDPQWKKDYAASVQRLVRDGVDKTLADQFVRAAKPYEPDAQDISKARSAAEAFLYRRLETLPRTANRFQLNKVLPIPFDGRGEMEVDFLCSHLRLAIELDGDQHLNDKTAYRRDRRKDVLLQENGYLVLRFLTDDVAKHLNDALDTILRAMTHQRNQTNQYSLSSKS